MSTILEFLNALSAAGLMAVLNTLWQSLAVAAVMWFILRLMPRVNAATRHAVWWAVLALVVLMPLPFFSLGVRRCLLPPFGPKSKYERTPCPLPRQSPSRLAVPMPLLRRSHRLRCLR